MLIVDGTTKADQQPGTKDRKPTSGRSKIVMKGKKGTSEEKGEFIGCEGASANGVNGMPANERASYRLISSDIIGSDIIVKSNIVVGNDAIVGNNIMGDDIVAMRLD